MKIKILKGDITKVPATIVVNAANNMLMSGGGVCGAIYKAAGYQLNSYTTSIIAENGNKALYTGETRISPSYNMDNCEHIVHAVGPIYNEELGEDLMAQLLMDAYRNSLYWAVKYGAKSISFPAISTGIYGYPMHKALKIVKRVLETTHYQGEVKLICFSDDDYKAYKSEIKPWKIYFTRMKRD